jgi:hypothetical protein
MAMNAGGMQARCNKGTGIKAKKSNAKREQVSALNCSEAAVQD